MKLKVGITGQNGFIGTHLYNALGLFPEDFERVKFDKDYFENNDKLDEFVRSCDAIVHLSALNRNPDQNVIYKTNVGLVQKLVESLKRTGKTSHVLFSSSSQEERDNLYGMSKLKGREIFIEWAKETNSSFTGLIIPNVFGPFGKPYYNSVVATFCHQLCNEEEPSIKTDSSINLIYVSDLVHNIIDEIRARRCNFDYKIQHTAEIKVSEILSILERYKQDYQVNGSIPELHSYFELCLFNTFRSYLNISNMFPRKYVKHEDARGIFAEVIKTSEGGQTSYSITLPGITRGNHYHTRKIERFAVIKGNALIQLRKIGTDEVFNFQLSGDEPAYVDMPVWYTHNIKNIGEEDLYTIFWINEFFDPKDPDTYFELV